MLNRIKYKASLSPFSAEKKYEMTYTECKTLYQNITYKVEQNQQTNLMQNVGVSTVANWGPSTKSKTQRQTLWILMTLSITKTRLFKYIVKLHLQKLKIFI